MITNKWLQRILFGIGILFLLFLLYENWKTITPIFSSIDWAICIISIFVAILSNLSIAFLYKSLLRKYGENIETALAIKIFFYGQITKYIPGKIWAVWYQRTHLNSPHATKAIIFTNMDLMGIILITITFMSISLLLVHHNVSLAIAIFIAGLIPPFFLAKSFRMSHIIVKIANHFSRTEIEFIALANNLVDPYRAAFLIAFFLFTYLFSNTLMLHAIFHFTLVQSLEIIAILGISWIIGVISIVSPGGIGVREIAFIFIGGYISETHTTIELLTSISIISRLWLISQETLGASIIFFLPTSINQ